MAICIGIGITFFRVTYPASFPLAIVSPPWSGDQRPGKFGQPPLSSLLHLQSHGQGPQPSDAWRRVKGRRRHGMKETAPNMGTCLPFWDPPPAHPPGPPPQEKNGRGGRGGDGSLIGTRSNRQGACPAPEGQSRGEQCHQRRQDLGLEAELLALAERHTDPNRRSFGRDCFFFCNSGAPRHLHKQLPLNPQESQC